MVKEQFHYILESLRTLELNQGDKEKVEVIIEELEKRYTLQSKARDIPELPKCRLVRGYISPFSKEFWTKIKNL